MLRSVIYLAASAVEIIVGLRFILRLLGANPSSDFVSWIYNWSEPLVQPFAGIFGQNANVVTGPSVVTSSVFDWTALIALIVYAIVAAVAARLLHRSR